jgi:hypothetical protein
LPLITCCCHIWNAKEKALLSAFVLRTTHEKLITANQKDYHNNAQFILEAFMNPFIL